MEKKRAESLTAISFLEAIHENLDKNAAFNIAVEAFEKYMTNLYKKVLASTEKGSQERFDRFRKFYEEFAEKTPYCEMVESTPTKLKAKFNRCPFYELLKEKGLEDLGHAFCLSDPAFTKNLLPGVKFSRKHEIARGGPYCDNKWEFGTNK